MTFDFVPECLVCFVCVLLPVMDLPGMDYHDCVELQLCCIGLVIAYGVYFMASNPGLRRCFCGRRAEARAAADTTTEVVEANGLHYEQPKDCCSICMDPILPPYEWVQLDSRFANVTRLKCGHWLHLACVNGWIEAKLRRGEAPNCPMCRRPMGDSMLIFPSAPVENDVDPRVRDEDYVDPRARTLLQLAVLALLMICMSRPVLLFWDTSCRLIGGSFATPTTVLLV